MTDQFGSQITELPFIRRGTGIADAIDQATNGETSVADATGEIAGEIRGLGLDAVGLLQDPIGTLVNAGLTIVLDLVQPLEDVLIMVTGDADAMQQQAEDLQQIQADLASLADDLTTETNNNITVWEGEAATAASDELGGMAAAARAMSKEAFDVSQLLDWARMLAETIYNVIKAVITELVSWLITRGLVALASSWATAGGSVAAFIASAALKGSMMMLRATRKYQWAQRIFRRLLALIRKIPILDRTAKGALWKGLLTKAGIAIGKTAAANAEELWADFTGSETPPEVGHITSPPGSFDGFSVEAGELTAMASALDNLEPTASQIASDAAGVGAAEMTWGLTGLAFETSYAEGCQGLIESTQNLTDAFSGEATKLRDCADAYASIDEDTAGEFDKLAVDLEG
ncbi:hypothetical protein [Glycomyces arizonensis]|uniref:hypothetical protein n=1 Tax=Glycomyces arizonensis TaxID=256035 RepID=UPI00040A9A96|nr:hypothetical protein [Glycomyces arizonensis]